MKGRRILPVERFQAVCGIAADCDKMTMIGRQTIVIGDLLSELGSIEIHVALR